MRAPQSMTLFLLSLTFGMASAAPAYPEYRVTVVAPANSEATDINSAGVVVGTYRVSAASTRGFLNRGKGLVDLGTLNGSSSSAAAINDKGEVLGNWTTRGGQQHGFIYTKGKQRDIGAIRGRITRYTDINNAGYITAKGDSRFAPDGSRGYLRDSSGKFRDIGNLDVPDWEGTPTLNTALALNNRNGVTGESGPYSQPDQPLRAYTWTKGVMRDLGDFGWAPNGGVAINDRGQITGHMSVPTGFRSRVAFIYSNGRLINIDGRPAKVEDRSSAGAGINNHGHVVGSSDHLSGFVYRGKRMQSLNALIDPAPGWNIVAPRAINDAGQIAATAYRKGVAYAVRLDLIRPNLLAAPELEAD
ncbi:HAF repeat-containing protein [Massilia sp. CMS3.1]|uniref:HAF repeat-containing protein n=1 Tax=Massilia sp. CMS3.1 TaxID=3373083 RepID=UPI003EE4FC8A